MSHEKGERCRVCRAPSSRAVCATCLDEHDARLRDLPLLAHALEDRFLRQQQFSVTGLGVRNPDEASLPYDDRAGRVRRELARVLLRWTLTFDIIDPLGYPAALGYSRLVPTVEAMTAHLQRHADVIAAHPLAGDVVHAVRTVHSKALRAVDRPPDLVYLGICSWPLVTEHGRVVEECAEDLYAEWGKSHARCRGCRNTHDVKSRQSVLLANVQDQLASAADISRGLAGLDIAVTAERIRQWKRRKRLIPRGMSRQHEAADCNCACHRADAVDPLGYPAALGYGEPACSVRGHCQGDPLYRVGDVVDRVMAERERLKAELRQPRSKETTDA